MRKYIHTYTFVNICLLVLFSCLSMVDKRCGAQEPQDLNILLFGNSFTQTNGHLSEYLHAMLSSNASFASQYDNINVLKTSVNGQTLQYHSGAGTATSQAIKSSTVYDYIIMQEYSTGTDPMNLTATQNINEMTQGGTKLYNTIHASASKDANILLFETWERPGNTIDLETIQAGYRVLDSTLSTFKENDGSGGTVSIVDVGTTWMDVKNLTSLNLYASDNYHQNAAGTYLNALKFYQKITGEMNVVGMYDLIKDSTLITTAKTDADTALKLEQVASGVTTHDASKFVTLTGTQSLGTPTYNNGKIVTASGTGTQLTAKTFNISNDATFTLENGATLNTTDTGFTFTRIGDNGTGVMNVFSGANFESASHVIVGRRRDAKGYLNIDGAGSRVDINSMLYLAGWSDGSDESKGYVTVTDGASLTATGITIGRTNNSVGALTVNNATVTTKTTGTFSWETNSSQTITEAWKGNMWVGATGRGVLNVQQGGTVTIANNLFAGYNTITAVDTRSTGNQIAVTGNGSILVQGGTANLSNTTVSTEDTGRFIIGTGATATSVGTAAGTYVGATGAGTLNTAGTTKFSNTVNVGNGGGAGTLNTAGTTTFANTVNIGNGGGAGTLNTAGTTTFSNTVNIGNGGGAGTINVTGTTRFDGDLYVGRTGNGKLDVQSGTTTVNVTNFNIGNASSATGTNEVVIQEGATLQVTGGQAWTRVGATGATGKLTVYGTYEDLRTDFSGTVLGRYNNGKGELLVSGENAYFKALNQVGNRADSVALGVGGYNGGNPSNNAVGTARVENGARMDIYSLKIGERAGATGTMTVDDATVSVMNVSNNSGSGIATVGQYSTGTLTLQNGATMTVDKTLTVYNNGTLTVDDTSSLTVTGGLTSSGTVNLANLTGNLTQTGGTVRTVGDGATIDGNYTQTDGTFEYILGDSNKPLVITGDMDLSSIRLGMADGFTFNENTLYNIIQVEGENRSGDIAVSLAGALAGLDIVSHYSGDGVYQVGTQSLINNMVPEPATWVLLVLGCLGILGARRVRK